MDYATAASARSTRSVVAVDFVIGTTTLRWASQAFRDTSGNQYEPRVLSWGGIDRRMLEGRLLASYVSLTVSNADGKLSPYLSEDSFADTNANAIRGKVTITRWVKGRDDAWYERTRDVLQYADLDRVTGDGRVTFKLTSPSDRHFGTMVPPTVWSVIGALLEWFPSRFASLTWNENVSAPVPVVYGHWGRGGDAEDGLATMEIGSMAHTFSGLGRALDSAVLVCGVSGEAFDLSVSALRTVFLKDGTGDAYRRTFADGTTVELESVDLTATAGYHVLLAFLARPAFTADARTVAKAGTGHPIDMVSATVGTFAANPNRWVADYVNVDAWAVAKGGSTAWRGRIAFAEPKDAADLIGEVATQYGYQLFYDRLGRLSAFNLVPVGGPSPSYSTALSLSKNSQAIEGSVSMRRARPGEASGVKNLATVGYRFPWRGSSEAVEVRNQESFDRYGAWSPVSLGGDLLDRDGVALAVGQAFTQRRSDPRWVVEASYGLEASTLDLGDLVRVTVEDAPDFSTGRLCAVWAISESPDGHEIRVTMVDYNADLQAKVYYLTSEADFRVTAGTRIDLTADSEVVQLTDDAGWFVDEGVLPGDILRVGGSGTQHRAGGNNFYSVIDQVYSGGMDLLGQAVGDPLGTLPTVTETVAAGEWEILRGQANRDTTGPSYTPVDPKYGILCGTDGLFLDGATEGYKL